MIDFMLTHGANHKAQLSGAQLAQAYACNKEVKDPIGALGVLVTHNIDIRGQPSPRVLSAMACATRSNNPALVQFLSDHGVVKDGPAEAAAASATSVDPRIVEIRDATIDLQATVENQTIDNVALMMTKQLASQDPTWNPKNPKWPSIFQRVREDLRADLSARLAASLIGAQGLWSQALSVSLSEEDIRQLVSFFRSDQGKRYIRFQRKLDVIVTAAILEMLQNPKSGPLANGPSNQDRHDKYAEFLNLSLSMRIGQANQKALTPAGASASVKESPWPSIIGVVISSHRAELDQLRGEYQRDLDGFAAFNGSAPLSHVLTANQLAMPQWVNSSMGRELSAAVIIAVTNRMPAWERAYGSDSPPRVSAITASAVGNAECVALDKMDNSHQPPEIYRNVRECIDREKYPEAAALFALGGMESQFDAARGF